MTDTHTQAMDVEETSVMAREPTVAAAPTEHSQAVQPPAMDTKPEARPADDVVSTPADVVQAVQATGVAADLRHVQADAVATVDNQKEDTEVPRDLAHSMDTEIEEPAAVALAVPTVVSQEVSEAGATPETSEDAGDVTQGMDTETEPTTNITVPKTETKKEDRTSHQKSGAATTAAAASVTKTETKKEDHVDTASEGDAEKKKRVVPKNLDDWNYLLEDEKSDWIQRCDIFLTLEESAIDRSHVDIMKLFGALKKGLALQLSDRRSSVIKQVSQTIALFAKQLKEDFVPMAEFLFPHFLKNTFVTIQIISDSSHGCLRQLFAHCQSSQLLHLALQAVAKDTHAQVRAKSGEYIRIALEHWPVLLVESRMEEIVQSVKTLLADAGAPARSAGRSLYCALAKKWAARAQRLHSKLDVSTKNLIQEEMRVYAPEEFGSSKASARPTTAVPKSKTRPATSAVSNFKAFRAKAKTAAPVVPDALEEVWDDEVTLKVSTRPTTTDCILVADKVARVPKTMSTPSPKQMRPRPPLRTLNASPEPIS